MPHHNTTLSGVIQHVFAHRFTLLADGETYLADLGPKGAESFPLSAGLRIDLEGERRPSEIKVTRIAGDGRAPVQIQHNKPHHAPGHRHPDVPANLSPALAMAAEAGWTTTGEHEQRPKHFEVLARRSDGPWTELHIDFAGTIYKQKPADPRKWVSARA